MNLLGFENYAKVLTIYLAKYYEVGSLLASFLSLLSHKQSIILNVSLTLHRCNSKGKHLHLLQEDKLHIAMEVTLR